MRKKLKAHISTPIEKYRYLNTLRILLSVFFIWLAWGQSILSFGTFIHFFFSILWMVLIETELLIETKTHWASYIPATLDIFVATVALLLTGNMHSPLMVGYFSLTAIAASLENRRYAIYVVLLCFFSYVGASAAVLAGLFPSIDVLMGGMVSLGSLFQLTVSGFLVGVGLGTVHIICFQFVKKNELLLKESQHLLKTVAHQESELRKRNSIIEKDLDLARGIYQRLLPDQLPHIPGLEFSILYLPQDKIGGDLYEVRRDANYVELMVADVSGHGVSSAFLAAIFRISMEKLDRRNPGLFLSAMNDALVNRAFYGFFMTAVYAVFDRKSKILRFACAGHPPPILLRRGRLIELEASGRLLGFWKGYVYEEKKIVLESGDRLFLFTDGIIEARSFDGIMHGERAFREILIATGNRAFREIPDTILGELKKLGNGRAVEDDITVLSMDILE